MRRSELALYAFAMVGLGALALRLEQNERLYGKPVCLPEMWNLFEVGPQKPMGYLNWGFIQENGYDVEAFAEHFEGEGKCTLMVEPHCGHFTCGTLYVYDPESLQALLDKHAYILRAEGWPEDADAFVSLVSDESVNGHTHQALYRLIGVAFNDQRFV